MSEELAVLVVDVEGWVADDFGGLRGLLVEAECAGVAAAPV